MDEITNWPYKGHDDLVCSICRKQTKSSDCELVEGTVLEVLEVVLINLNLTTIKPVVCNDCNKKLLDAFQHKSKWIYTEDRLFPYINSATDGKVDMHTVYLAENDCKRSDIETGIQICRMCMELINDKTWNVLFDILEKQYSLEMFEKYVPELNLSATENPIICKICLDSLRVFMSFVTSYQDKEVKTEDYFEVREESKPGGIYPAAIEDLEQNCNSKGSLEILKSHPKKHLPLHKPKKRADLIGCKICSYRSSYKVDIENHSLIHQTKSFKCKTCNFRTNNKYYLKKHQMQHKVLETMFKCALCSYATKYKGRLQRHVVSHKDSNLKVFKCESCSYVAKCKGNLRRHVQIHTPISMVETIKCKFCAFETKHKSSLERHLRIHKPPSAGELFKCEFCSFETRYKEYLPRHALIHKISEKVYKCELCSHATNQKSNLRRHSLIHKPFSNVKVYKCEFCSHVTRQKSNLRRHILIHQPLSNVEMYKCEHCYFQTKHKNYLRRHILKHTPMSSVKTFKCEFCSYQSKRIDHLKLHLITHN